MTAPPLLSQILEAYPAPTFLVDGDVVVQLANHAARDLAAVREGESVPQVRAGELLRCVHTDDHPEGCGRSEACQTCVIRGAVATALLSGAVSRQQAALALRAPVGAQRELHVLVSAAPVEVEDARLAVLVLEDVSEIVRLGRAPQGPPAGREASFVFSVADEPGDPAA